MIVAATKISRKEATGGTTKDMGYTLSRETVIRVSVIGNGISFREKMDMMIERTAEER